MTFFSTLFQHTLPGPVGGVHTTRWTYHEHSQPKLLLSTIYHLLGSPTPPPAKLGPPLCSRQSNHILPSGGQPHFLIFTHTHIHIMCSSLSLALRSNVLHSCRVPPDIPCQDLHPSSSGPNMDQERCQELILLRRVQRVPFPWILSQIPRQMPPCFEAKRCFFHVFSRQQVKYVDVDPIQRLL